MPPSLGSSSRFWNIQPRLVFSHLPSLDPIPRHVVSTPVVASPAPGVGVSRFQIVGKVYRVVGPASDSAFDSSPPADIAKIGDSVSAQRITINLLMARFLIYNFVDI